MLSLNHPVMSADAERAAFARYAAARTEHGAGHKRAIAARNAIVVANLRLAAKIATRIRGLTFEERTQEGVFGLITAVERFDPERGRFSTFAVWWIRHFIARAAADCDRTVRIPLHLQDTRTRERRDGVDNRDGVALEHGGYSLDAPVSSSQEERGDWYGITADERLMPQDELLDREQRAVLARELVDELDERERDVVTARFGLDGQESLTLKQIGQEMNGGRSRERVRQIERDALEQMRELCA